MSHYEEKFVAVFMSKSNGGAMFRKSLFASMLVLTSTMLFAQGGGKTDTSAPSKVTGEPKKTASGVSYWDITVGTGAVAEKGKTVTVHYTGWLTNGKKFDSSVDRGDPFSFKLGAHEVILGWDEGVAGMKIGGKRQLKIPPEAGYGQQGTPGGPIPPNATLIFDVELLGVK
jgi:FKBP-type peptidyl-prolyl cis-trans isomerase